MADILNFLDAQAGKGPKAIVEEKKRVDVDIQGITKKVAEMFAPLEIPFILLAIDPSSEGYSHTSNMFSDAQLLLMEKIKFLILQATVGGGSPEYQTHGTVPTTEVPQ